MTAVEWLEEQQKELVIQIKNGEFQIEDFEYYNAIYIEQAKDMEKEQMKIAQMYYSSDVVGFKTLLENQFEEWYNQTFKSE
jgi:predicted metal-dependent hydrolase